MSAVILRMSPDEYADVANMDGGFSTSPGAGTPRSGPGADGEGLVRILVAEDLGRVVGVVLVTHDLRKGWMNRLAVLPGEHGKGIAKDLVRRAEEELTALGIGTFALRAQERNLVSRGLYAGLGYEEHGGIAYLSKRSGPAERKAH